MLFIYFIRVPAGYVCGPPNQWVWCNGIYATKKDIIYDIILGTEKKTSDEHDTVRRYRADSNDWLRACAWAWVHMTFYELSKYA